MPPSRSYTIWFSQRTGSTLLCKALESTGIAGMPVESLEHRDLFIKYRDNPLDLQEHLWMTNSTPNGVCGLKVSFYEPRIQQVVDLFSRLPGRLDANRGRVGIWEKAFPNHRHIMMTRRNKVRQAVSWWKAIQSQEWHRVSGEHPKPADLADKYHFDAINQLFTESSMREAGIQEFLSEGGIIPLTVVYEDFILDYEGTVRTVLDYLGLDSKTAVVSPPYFSRLADEVSEAWAQRFRAERQNDWDNKGW